MTFMKSPLGLYYRCLICRFRSTSTHIMVNHLREHTSNINKKVLFRCHEDIDTYKCHKCLYESHFKVDFNRHVYIFHRITQYPFYICQLCGFKTHSLIVFLKHIDKKRSHKLKTCTEIERSHDKEESDGQRKRQEEKWFKCDKCFYICRLRKKLLQHSFLKHGMKSFQCQFCFYRSKNRNRLKLHVTKNHENQKAFFTCKYCPYKSKYRISFRAHERMQHFKPIAVKEEWLSCDVPLRPERTIPLTNEIPTINKNGLRKLIRKDCGDLKKITRFGCLHCSFKTKYKHCLNYHIINKHTRSEDINWFMCDLCCFKTKCKTNLKRHHQVKHTPDEEIVWFQCDLCPYKAKQKRSLVGHLQKKHPLSAAFH